VAPAPPFEIGVPAISRLASRLLHTSNIVFEKCGSPFWFLAAPAAKSWRWAWARYSALERIKIAEAYFATTSVVPTHWQYRWDFPGRNAPIRLELKRLQDKFRETECIQVNLKVAMAGNGQLRQKSHRVCETTFGRISNANHQTFVSGDRSFEEFSYAHYAPVISPVTVYDTDFTTSDWCK